MKEIDNYKTRKYTITEATALANRLVSSYNNPDFYRWYCKAIKILGVQRVVEIEASVRDANYPARVFSKIVKEEMLIKESTRSLSSIKAQIGIRR